MKWKVSSVLTSPTGPFVKLTGLRNDATTVAFAYDGMATGRISPVKKVAHNKVPRRPSTLSAGSFGGHVTNHLLRCVNSPCQFGETCSNGCTRVNGSNQLSAIFCGNPAKELKEFASRRKGTRGSPAFGPSAGIPINRRAIFFFFVFCFFFWDSSSGLAAAHQQSIRKSAGVVVQQ